MNLVLALGLAGSMSCAANLCQRKDSAMKRCTAGNLSYTGDPSCERNLEVCGPEKLKVLEGYVMCLESLNQCTLDTMNACGSQHPGAVNLSCSG